jgi:hypothetical protein
MIFTKKDFINIEGINYPIKFNNKVFHEFAEQTQIKFFDFIQAGDLFNQHTTTLIFFALREGYRIEGKEFNIKEEDIAAMDLDVTTLFIEKMGEVIDKMGNGQKAVLKAEANKKRKV